MNRKSKCSIALGLFSAIFFLLAASVLRNDSAIASDISQEEIERYVQARIDIGESMRHFFRNRKPPQFGPEGGPSMDALRKLEAEINNRVSEILAKYELTIERYQNRSPEVFADEAGVQAFLSSRPEIKKRYENLPQNPRRRGPRR